MKAGLIIPIAKKNAANTWMKNNIDREGGERTFTVLLGADESGPATHVAAYWTNMDRATIRAFKKNLNATGADLIQKIEQKSGGTAYKNKTPKQMLSLSGLVVVSEG